MPPTYFQLIDEALTHAAKEGRDRFSLTWLRCQIRTRARKVKKQLGPHLNKAILRVLKDGEQIGYFRLTHGRRAQDISILMTGGGRHEYANKDTVVVVEAQVSRAKTRNELRQENEFLQSELVKMEARLVRANSILDLDFQNNNNVEVVTGTPAAITERIKRLIVLSKDRKLQIEQMYESDQFQTRLEVLNDYYERDMQERAEREGLIQAYQEWCAEEGVLTNPERRGDPEE